MHHVSVQSGDTLDDVWLAGYNKTRFLYLHYPSLKEKKDFESVQACRYHCTLGQKLTNKFHVAICLFSNRSQMTSICGKNKKVAHEVQPGLYDNNPGFAIMTVAAFQK